jgi:hypothetical protein
VKALDPRTVGAIVLVDTFTPGLEQAPLIAWLGDTQWRELTFSEPSRYFSPAEWRYVDAGDVSHKVLVPAEASATENKMITIDPSVSSDVGANPLLDGPPWGLEQDYAGPGLIAWLGQGNAQGMGGTLTSKTAQTVTVAIDVVPGPSRPGITRTVELDVGEGADQRVLRQTFVGGIWRFKVELRPGANPFRLGILDDPTVLVQPNGDKRTMLALVRRIKVSK